jgi:hypothetical protein
MAGGAGPPVTLARALRIVAGITGASGVLQMTRPEWVLGQVSPDHTPLQRHLFATIGMFMAASGGTLHRSVATPTPDRDLLAWAAVQKLGASAAVGIGVCHRLFSRRALLVAAFDLASGLCCVAYARQLRRTSTTG